MRSRGDAPDLATMQKATGNEVANAFGILLPIIVAILILSTMSWIEPLLFFAAIGISILINMGTNIIFGEISFMTNSVSPILQWPYRWTTPYSCCTAFPPTAKSIRM